MARCHHVSGIETSPMHVYDIDISPLAAISLAGIRTPDKNRFAIEHDEHYKRS